MGGYEFPGDVYEIVRRDFRNLGAETDLLASLAPPAGRFLDVGSGTGTNLRALAERGHSGVGVDQSASFTDHAKNAGGGNIEFVLGSMTEFETGDTFDVVYCLFSTLNLVPPHELPGLLARARRWLRPGGHLVLDPGHLLNYVDSYQPSMVAHHRGDGLLVTRLTRTQINAHTANWRNEETVLVSRPDGHVSLYPNFFDQWVVTAPELRRLLCAAGFEVTAEYGSFRGDGPPPFGRGPLIQVARVADDAR
ncbi:class I SAM-dependent methyltransferase [Micromonospora sp. BQ11]|uniref:class I SAM-dependent methyltransferase n=1 Tax=Micromonospora sp. BQ11 TaxID=3452212 RepID=UPI003F8B275D